MFTHDLKCNSQVHQVLTTYLFERELNGFMFPLFEHIHQLHDGLVVPVQLLLARCELVFTLREVDKLFQCLLVHMAVFLQLCVALVKLLPQLQSN